MCTVVSSLIQHMMSACVAVLLGCAAAACCSDAASAATEEDGDLESVVKRLPGPHLLQMTRTAAVNVMYTCRIYRLCLVG